MESLDESPTDDVKNMDELEKIEFLEDNQEKDHLGELVAKYMEAGKAKPRCIVCDKECTSKCSKCKEVYYCSKDHQVQNWPLHKQFCIEVSRRPVYEKTLQQSSNKNSQ